MIYTIKIKEGRQIKEIDKNINEESVIIFQKALENRETGMIKLGDEYYNKHNIVSVEKKKTSNIISQDFQLQEPEKDLVSITETLKQGFYNLKKVGLFKNDATYEEWLEKNKK